MNHNGNYDPEGDEPSIHPVAFLFMLAVFCLTLWWLS